LRQSGDPDAAFAARHYLERALRQLAAQQPERRDEITGIAKKFDAFIEEKFGDKLDRFPIRDGLRRAYRDKSMSLAEAAGFRAVAALSETQGDFTRLSVAVQSESLEITAAQMLLDTWEEISKTIADNMRESEIEEWLILQRERTVRLVEKLRTNEHTATFARLSVAQERRRQSRSVAKGRHASLESAKATASSRAEVDAILGGQASAKARAEQ
jgi:hypothetical protein